VFDLPAANTAENAFFIASTERRLVSTRHR